MPKAAQFVRTDRAEGVAILTLDRPPVNALNPAVVAELTRVVASVAELSEVSAAVLTGSGPFFSFGFDVPKMYDQSRGEFRGFVESFLALCRRLFAFPKPLVAALNGHAVAGGCMLATACDYRVMKGSGALIGLNEVTLGATVFFGTHEMLVHAVGSRSAEHLETGGALIEAEEAQALGLIDETAPGEGVLAAAIDKAQGASPAFPDAFAELKRLSRAPILETIDKGEGEGIERFLDLWYSPATRRALREIRIRDRS